MKLKNRGRNSQSLLGEAHRHSGNQLDGGQGREFASPTKRLHNVVYCCAAVIYREVTVQYSIQITCICYEVPTKAERGAIENDLATEGAKPGF